MTHTESAPTPTRCETGSPIVIDGVFFQLNDSGIARLWTELLHRWQGMELGRRIIVLDRARSLPAFPRLRTMPCPAFDAAQWSEDRDMLQDLCDAVGAGGFVSTYYTRPVRTPARMLVYDMIPERLGFDLSKPVWQQKRDAIIHATAYAAISRNTLEDLGAIYPATRAKPCIVVYPGVSLGFRPPAETEQKAFQAGITGPRLQGRPYFLVVGELTPYKNSDLLLGALRRMTHADRSGIGLLFTRGHSRIQAFRELSGLAVHVARMTDPGLRAAYGSALALVYPSRYEGFGMPPLEAMACGCPVICSNAASLPEVVGEAALLVDPEDDEALLAALRQVRDPETRRRLRREGLARSESFSWDRMAVELQTFLLEGCSDFQGAR